MGFTAKNMVATVAVAVFAFYALTSSAAPLEIHHKSVTPQYVNLQSTNAKPHSGLKLPVQAHSHEASTRTYQNIQPRQTETSVPLPTSTMSLGNAGDDFPDDFSVLTGGDSIYTEVGAPTPVPSQGLPLPSGVVTIFTSAAAMPTPSTGSK